MAAAAHKKAPVAGGEPFDPMKYVDKGVKMLQNVIESEMTQLRAPLVLGAGVGRLGFSVAWMVWIHANVAKRFGSSMFGCGR